MADIKEIIDIYAQIHPFHPDYKPIINKMPSSLVKRAFDQLLNMKRNPISLEEISEKNLLNLNVTLIKVKGHSGDIYNNIANDLARLGIQSLMISINYLQVYSLNLLFQFDDIIIESSARHFLKNIFAATAVSNIIDLHKNADLKSLTQQSKVYWISLPTQLLFNRENSACS
ncbi:2639_t:CDS:2 [Funneliformis geosporum]|nr:2639_t:CDS:2 [Funneliformis geosporum]